MSIQFSREILFMGIYRLIRIRVNKVSKPKPQVTRCFENVHQKQEKQFLESKVLPYWWQQWQKNYKIFRGDTYPWPNTHSHYKWFSTHFPPLTIFGFTTFFCHRWTEVQIYYVVIKFNLPKMHSTVLCTVPAKNTRRSELVACSANKNVFPLDVFKLKNVTS